MTHTPSESKAWPNAGAADRPSASGEQTQRQSQGLNQRQSQEQGQIGQPASDLPSAAADESAEGTTPAIPEAKRHEGDSKPDGRSGSESERT